MRVVLGIVGLLWAGAVDAAPLPCQVSQVIDGDTLHLVCDGVDHRVRLLGFDTPEISHSRCAAEANAGARAAEVLRRLVATGPVTYVRFDGKDRYGRDLGEVAIAGQDVARIMLGSGLARPYAGGRRRGWCAG